MLYKEKIDIRLKSYRYGEIGCGLVCGGLGEGIKRIGR